MKHCIKIVLYRRSCTIFTLVFPLFNIVWKKLLGMQALILEVLFFLNKIMQFIFGFVNIYIIARSIIACIQPFLALEYEANDTILIINPK